MSPGDRSVFFGDFGREALRPFSERMTDRPAGAARSCLGIVFWTPSADVCNQFRTEAAATNARRHCLNANRRKRFFRLSVWQLFPAACREFVLQNGDSTLELSDHVCKGICGWIQLDRSVGFSVCEFDLNGGLVGIDDVWWSLSLALSGRQA
jgi:hypothetical protein